MNDRTLTVVGVMPPGFAFPEFEQLYLPLRWESAPRGQRSIATFGLLKPGQTVGQAQREIDALAAHLARTHPATHHDWTMRVMTFRDLMVDGGDRRLTTTLLAAVVFVLLIGCANLAGLLLARGATRVHLLRGTLVESAVVAALGTGIGLLAAAWALEAMPLAFADGLPYWADLRPDARVALFTAGLTALTAVLLGAAPGPALLQALRQRNAEVVICRHHGLTGRAAGAQRAGRGAGGAFGGPRDGRGADGAELPGAPGRGRASTTRDS